MALTSDLRLLSFMTGERKRTVIRIVNPIANGSRYTTQASARRFVMRGIAKWSGHEAIEMIRNQELCSAGRISIAHELARMADDKLVAQRRGGMVYWNGADQRDSAMHAPFHNVQFEKPGVRPRRRPEC